MSRHPILGAPWIGCTLLTLLTKAEVEFYGVQIEHILVMSPPPPPTPSDALVINVSTDTDRTRERSNVAVS